jgi:hypothetical protein
MHEYLNSDIRRGVEGLEDGGREIESRKREEERKGK